MRLAPASLAAALLVALVAPAHSSTWTPQTSPTTDALNGVAWSDSSTWVAVGDFGTIIRSTDAGISWGPVTSPVGDQLHGVALRGNLGLAVGVGGRILRSTDAGASWTVVARPTTKILFAASIADSFAVITGEEGRIFYSLDQGLTWTPTFAGTGSALFGVSANGNSAVAVGGAGAVAMSPGSKGSGWGLTVIGTQLTFFYGMSLITPATGWLVGTSDVRPSIVARTDDGGFVWSAQTAPSADQLFGVSFYSITQGTAVGGTGTIIHTEDGGAHWLSEPSGVTEILHGVSFIPSGLGIAVGGAGTILRAMPDVVTGVGPGPALAPRPGIRVLGDPVRGSASARFAVSLTAAAPVSLRVLDTAGRVVATLVERSLPRGTHEFVWAGPNDRGARAPAGIYFAQLRAGEERASARFVILD
ncbi:MAG TPA: YCF48-related protein [Candidatus Eisenbacteria bacterium]